MTEIVCACVRACMRACMCQNRCVPDSTLLPRSRREVLLYCYDRQSYCVTMYKVTVSYVYNTKTTLRKHADSISKKLSM